MMLDTAILLLIRVLLALLLLGASLHKFSDRNQFTGILAAYRLVPMALLPMLVVVIPLVELALGLAWLTGIQTGSAAIATALLLSAYTLAIAINLLRGNVDIDCGCGFGSSSQAATGYQRLSAALLLRNGLLISVALVAILPSNERLLGILDYSYVGLASCGLLLLYGAFNQLLANTQIINSWNTTEGERR